MPWNKKEALLATDIAAALHEERTAATCVVSGPPAGQLPKKILLTGIAIAALQPDFSLALTLGDIAVESALGQPFVATTTARLGPGESLGPDCVTALANMVGGTASSSSLNISTKAALTPGLHPLQITSKAPLYEPMYEIRLQVKCPGTMNLSRTYLVMLNLPMTPAQNVLNNVPATPDSITVSGIQSSQTQRPVRTNRSSTETAKAASSSRDTAAGDTVTISSAARLSTPQIDSQTTRAIAASSEYRVARGDTLSGIAQRVSGRPAGSTWQVADLIFKENPQAFQNNNPDRLKMGYILRIPGTAALQDAPTTASLTGDTPAISRARPEELERAATIAHSPSVSLADESIETIPNITTSNIQMDRQQTAYIEIPDSSAADPTVQSDFSLQSEAEAMQSASVIDLSSAQSTQPYTQLAEGSTLENTGEANVPEAVVSNSSLTATDGPNNDTANSSTALPTATPEGSSRTAVNLAAIISILLAGLLVGRKYLLAMLPTRNHRSSEHQSVARLQKPIADDATNEAPQDVTTIPVAQTAAESGEVTSAYIVAEIADENADRDLNIASADSEEMSEVEPAPRINLHESNANSEIDFDMSDMAESLNQTEKDSRALNDSGDIGSSDMSDTGTMRNLFNSDAIDLDDDAPTTDLAAIADSDPTAELPNLDSHPIDIEATSSLQTLSDTVDDGNPDDELSQTLTQALGLLEKDYEDEMTASQILEQKDIDRAFKTGSFKH